MNLTRLTILLLSAVISTSNEQKPETQENRDSTVIRPGLSAGPLELGDSYKRATELFPPKPRIDQEFSQAPGCGKELN